MNIWTHLLSEPYDITGRWEIRDSDDTNSISVIYEFTKSSVTIYSVINKSVKSKSEYQYTITNNLLYIYRYKIDNNADIIKENYFIIKEANKNLIKLEAANNAGREPTGAVLILKKINRK
ncbi:MAG: hypothetical protein JXK07_07355 [Spirochaetes bacterium]|nr:hypothetical protein [Spirochaetota bacterium]